MVAEPTVAERGVEGLNLCDGMGFKPSGVQILVPNRWVPDELEARVRAYNPRTDLGVLIKQAAKLLPRELALALIDQVQRSVVLQSSLSLRALYADGRVEDFGVVGRKLITDNGVAYLVDAWQNSVEMENMKYHALGTGSTAENQTDSALVTELTTEYTGNVRATGSTTEASAAVFRSVGTNTLDGTPGAALREHGIFSQAATGGGVLWDRTVYAAVTLSSGDSLESTYDMTASAGG